MEWKVKKVESMVEAIIDGTWSAEEIRAVRDALYEDEGLEPTAS